MQRLRTDKRHVIDATKPWHVAWWAAELGVSEESLLEAVYAVGDQARAVELHLGRGKPRERRRAPRRADAVCTIEMEKREDLMIYPNSTEVARLLQDLLADAHARIRELQTHVEQLSDELLTLQVNDRRSPVGSRSKVERERRRAVVHPIESQRERIEPTWQVH